MRKSVLTGLLVCAFVITSAPTQASASTDEVLPTNEEESPALVLAAVVDEIQDKVEEAEKQEEKNVVHKVEHGETLESIAQQYETTWQRIFNKNEKLDNPDLIEVNEKLEIPNEDEEIEAREIEIPEPVQSSAPTVNTTQTTRKATPIKTVKRSSNRATAHSGWFPAGQCTQYVASRRPVGQWNDASSWFWQAQRDGWATGYTARVGAAAVSKSGNHVAYVEKVKGSQVYISERNYDWNGSYRERWAPASNYKYIY